MEKQWHKWEYRKPLAARGGIKLRTRRGRAVGSNWWSRRWMEIITGCIDAARIVRGRSYARKGQVLGIEIEAGLVSASVQGSRQKPYLIKLGFATISDEARELLRFRFRERASFAAKLLAGEMPEEIEGAFAEAGVPLFPLKSEIRRFKCSCPDDATPCKHIIAVLLILGEVFDDDPFLLLKLRGVDKEALINLLTTESRVTYEDEAAGSGEEEEWGGDGAVNVISGGSDENNETAAAEEAKSLPLDENWYHSELPQFPGVDAEQPSRAAALEVLNEFPFWRGEHPFRATLTPYYERAAIHAMEIITGEKHNPVGRPRKLI
jgi:uncharacterized Zn finger protein